MQLPIYCVQAAKDLESRVGELKAEELGQALKARCKGVVPHLSGAVLCCAVLSCAFGVLSVSSGKGAGLGS